MIIDLIDKAVESGARLKKAAAIMGLSARTIIRWRQQGGGQDQRKGPSTAPANKLSEQERQQILRYIQQCAVPGSFSQADRTQTCGPRCLSGL